MADSDLDPRTLELRIAHERELREAISGQLRDALERQAREYERRLTELNHAHARADAVSQSFVRQEVCSMNHAKAAEWRESVVAALAENRGQDERSRKTWAVVIVAITVTINVIALAIALFVLGGKP